MRITFILFLTCALLINTAQTIIAQIKEPSIVSNRCTSDSGYLQNFENADIGTLISTTLLPSSWQESNKCLIKTNQMTITICGYPKLTIGKTVYASGVLTKTQGAKFLSITDESKKRHEIISIKH